MKTASTSPRSSRISRAVVLLKKSRGSESLFVRHTRDILGGINPEDRSDVRFEIFEKTTNVAPDVEDAGFGAEKSAIAEEIFDLSVVPGQIRAVRGDVIVFRVKNVFVDPVIELSERAFAAHDDIKREGGGGIGRGSGGSHSVGEGLSSEVDQRKGRPFADATLVDGFCFWERFDHGIDSGNGWASGAPK
ncbi:MAG: hypothetical protein R3F31_18655 [Verrucomicrobiales bacterium]